MHGPPCDYRARLHGTDRQAGRVPQSEASSRGARPPTACQRVVGAAPVRFELTSGPLADRAATCLPPAETPTKKIAAPVCLGAVARRHQ
jgi:hypothetical protein